MTEPQNLESKRAQKGHKQHVLELIQNTLKALDKLFADPEIDEIMINGANDVFYSKGGEERRFNCNLSASSVQTAIGLIASFIQKEVAGTSKRARLSARLPGFRIEAILPPVAVYGPAMCFRRHSTRFISLDEYVASGVCSPKYAQIFHDAIQAKENFLIAGGTGTGKTTLMNSVLHLIPPTQRLFVIENIHELQISAPNKVVVEWDEDHGMNATDAVRVAMRMFPKRIIVGELRGAEAYDWLDACNTGHPGSGATIHANSAKLTIPRLESLLRKANTGIPHDALCESIADSLRWVFYINREGKERRISQVSRLNGYDRETGKYDIEYF